MSLLDKAMSYFAGGRGKRDDVSFDSFHAVADVALAIAALDGAVLPEEMAAYRWISGRCAGLSDVERRKRLDAAVGLAGRLLLMAQVDAYSEADRLAAFGEAVGHVLPNGGAGFSQTDIRRAFVLWLSMAVSDGECSAIERQAILFLRDRLVSAETLEAGFLEMAEDLLRNLADPERRGEAERALDRLVVFSAENVI